MIEITPRNAFAIDNGLVPRNGPKALPIRALFRDDVAVSVDLREANYRKQVEGVQSIYWLNLTEQEFVVAPQSEAGSRIVIPPRSCGTTPFVLPSPEVFSIAAEATGVYLDIQLYNVPMPAAVWSIDAAAGGNVYVGDLVDGPGAPGDGLPGQLIVVNQDGDGLEYVDPPEVPELPPLTVGFYLAYPPDPSEVVAAYVFAEDVTVKGGDPDKQETVEILGAYNPSDYATTTFTVRIDGTAVADFGWFDDSPSGMAIVFYSDMTIPAGSVMTITASDPAMQSESLAATIKFARVV